MKINKPYWGDGILLSQHHFQQQILFNDKLLEYKIKCPKEYHKGISNFEVDVDALDIDKFICNQIEGIFDDGLFFSTDLLELQISARDLSLLKTDKSELTVYICVPIHRKNNDNLISPFDDADETVSDYCRYKVISKSIDDLYKKNAENEILVEIPNIQIKFSCESLENYVHIPIARIMKTNLNWKLDNNYVPCYLNLDNQYFSCYVKSILSLLKHNISNLNKYKKSNNGIFVNYTISDVSLLNILLLLNDFVVTIENYDNYLNSYSPFELFKTLSQLIAKLDIFLVKSYKEIVPLFDVDNYFVVFEGTKKILSEQFLNLSPFSVFVYDMNNITSTQWQVLLPHDQIGKNWSYYISVKSDNYSAQELLDLLPNIIKVGSPSKLDNIINFALNGCVVNPILEARNKLPFKYDSAFFEILFNNEDLLDLSKEALCNIYIPNMLNNLRINFYTVLNDE